ncbi:MAG: hypothetical protein KDB58_10380 [Solirubrobacterales bacterium]|nr:hypothetical protein [Solirubrobacterales bacterium]MCB8970577.1 hypothetical protein [Thermoleophilales bacterium]MCO5325738.1 hypothetical protein [Solirubrobacterales bacterium]
MVAGIAALLATALVLAACGGGGGDDTGGDVTLDQATVTSNLEDAGYAVAEASPGQSALPSLVDADFATGPDSGFESAIQVSGNGLKPFDPTDVSETGFVLLYSDADAATAADDGIGDGPGQQVEGNALFIYGTGLDEPPQEFTDMVAAATGQ